MRNVSAPLDRPPYTNQRAELAALLQALCIVLADPSLTNVTIATDSAYAKGCGKPNLKNSDNMDRRVAEEWMAKQSQQASQKSRPHRGHMDHPKESTKEGYHSLCQSERTLQHKGKRSCRQIGSTSKQKIKEILHHYKMLTSRC
jgi:ribonuclease HI